MMAGEKKIYLFLTQSNICYQKQFDVKRNVQGDFRSLYSGILKMNGPLLCGQLLIFATVGHCYCRPLAFATAGHCYCGPLAPLLRRAIATAGLCNCAPLLLRAFATAGICYCEPLLLRTFDTAGLRSTLPLQLGLRSTMPLGLLSPFFSL